MMTRIIRLTPASNSPLLAAGLPPGPNGSRYSFVECPLCGSARQRVVYSSIEPFMRIVRCADCRLMYQNPQAPETTLSDAHRELEGYLHFQNQTQDKVALFRARIRRFCRRRSLPSAGDFLDIGAGYGAMLDAVKRELPGWTCWAVEPSPTARDCILGKNYPAVATLDGLGADKNFDWVNLDNVLEHIPDPLNTLRILRSRLKPNGFLYVEVPNESLLPIRHRINDFVRGYPKLPTAPGHITLFTRPTLRQMVRAAGYSSLEMWLESVSVQCRLYATLGLRATPRVKVVLRFLNLTKLDKILGLAYFICCRARK